VSNSKQILFYFGHPAQFLFAKNTIRLLKEKGCKTHLLIKTKEVLENLIISEGFDYENILNEGRKDSSIGMLAGLLKRDFRILQYVRKYNIDLMIGTDPALSHVGKLMGIPVITVLEDDCDVIPKLVKLTYPYTSHIFAPTVCRVGEKYQHKKISYEGYMKLAYLHPSYFTPDVSKKPESKKPYILIRLAKLTAHHDDNIKGIDFSLIDQIIEMTEKKYQIFINSEESLPDKYEKFKLSIDPKDMHHVLNFAELFISDSQSMTVEAAMLGVPSIRYSDFIGKISVIEELEHKYDLTVSVKPPDIKSLVDQIDFFLNKKDLKQIFQDRRKKMLSEKVDVTELLTNLIISYPELP